MIIQSLSMLTGRKLKNSLKQAKLMKKENILFSHKFKENSHLDNTKVFALIQQIRKLGLSNLLGNLL